MRLSQLVPLSGKAALLGSGDPEIADVVYDSRRCGPGVLFVAVPGLKVDGHDFLRSALDKATPAAVVQRDHENSWGAVLNEGGIPAIVVDDTRSALAVIAAELAGNPARRLGVIGITGTDGKTSLAHLVDHVLRHSGLSAGLVTTAECRIGERPLLDTGRFTTPEAPELQSMLRQMVEAGCDWAVVEATSHGLALHRVDCAEFDIAAVTTIGSDHLDFHGNREAYVAAKGRLVEMLDESVQKRLAKTAVLNGDDPEFGRFKGRTRARILSFGFDAAADVRADDVRATAWGSKFVVNTAAGSGEMTMQQPGGFSVQNALAATGVGFAAGLSLAEIIPGVSSWRGAPGRMELIDEGQPFRVIVDFAHAPDSLERVLGVLRASSPGRLVVVFGCIGERERDRRHAMGRVAAERADFTIVTDDNPYTEDREAIIAEIVVGLEACGKRRGHDFAVIPDRREAIAHALAMAVDQDTILLAGKGHETEVHLPEGGYECDDRAVARSVIRDLLGTPLSKERI